MKSSGGVAPAAEAARAGAWSVLSGPAGGAVGAGLLAALSGDGNAIGLDMGGTSCDVCVVEDGQVRRTDSREIGGRVIQLPMVDVHTVGAGGGSVGWLDAGGALRVGPQSAGADPGPACYGRGGTEPTVTDANLLLGYLDAHSTLAGGVRLDAEAAGDAVGRLGSELGLGELETAEGIVRVANQEMVRALRVVTVERGVDPRHFALMPFGGAGPMHAAALADELGIDRILCPRASGVLSALGLIASERRRDTARTVLLSGEELTGGRIAAEVAALRQSIEAGIEEATAEATYELRYAGQAFELSISGPVRPDPADLAERFAARARTPLRVSRPRRGDRARPHPTGARRPQPEALAARGPCRRRSPKASGRRDSPASGSRRGSSAASRRPGPRAEGPCVLELPEATLVLPPGWRAEVDDHGTIAAARDR